MSPVRPKTGRPLGVYIHFPWCQRRCPYCDFNTRVDREIPHDAYRDAVLAELRARRTAFGEARLASIYFGGGTPSLWRQDCVADVIAAVRESFPLYDDPFDQALARETGAEDALEVTLEINPRAANPERLAAIAASGVNRLSVGLQTFDAGYLARLGRDHSVEQALETLADADRVGLRRISFDLLFGGPAHDLPTFERDLAAAATLTQPDHVSAYSLIIEPETPFARLHAEGRLRPSPEDDVVEMLTLCEARLATAGYRKYEISNYARPGREARHNSLYWTGGEYMGLGVGAHELLLAEGHAHRRAGALTPAAYIADPTTAHDFTETLTPTTHLAERIFLGLRTHFGISVEELVGQFGQEARATIEDKLERVVRRGWATQATAPLAGPAYLVPEGTRWVPTATGYLFANQVAMEVL